MRQLLIILSILLHNYCFGQNLLSGKIIDYADKNQNISAYILLIDSKGNKVDEKFSDEFGIFQFKNINEGTYNVEINHVGYSKIIIQNIKINEDTDLCNLYIYEASQLWDGSEYKKCFFGLFKKKIKDVGGYKIGYLESNNKKGKVILNYFCNEEITGIFKNGILVIDYKFK